MDIFQKSITPDKPRVLAEEQIYVYVPMATSTNAGIASYNRDQFDIIGSEVSLKWPAESFAQGPIETPSIVKVLDNEFEYTGNLVDLISGNSKISSDKLEVQLKRILRDAYERPELVMLDPNYFVRTIVEKDGKQYYKYNTTAVHYNISQNLSEDEQAQARQNISASSISDNDATNKRIDALLQTGVYSINGKTGNVVLKNSDLENDTNYATEQYVQENGGKIDKILLNNEEQEIVDKVVNLIIDKTTVGLSNVDNTSDLNKPISTQTQTALDGLNQTVTNNFNNLNSSIENETERATLAETEISTKLQQEMNTRVQEHTEIQGKISAINSKIPNQASSTNQLADKAFVNSTINSSAAFFKGSFESKAALDAVQWQTTDSSLENYVTNNDYAYVEADETHNNEAWRYIYVKDNSVSEWRPQFRVNETPFTQAQLDAINSGATTDLINSINSKLTVNDIVDETGDSSTKAISQRAATLGINAVQTNLNTHISNTNNPHNVTKTQIGLGNVDNTSDLDKPVSTAVQNALKDYLPLSGGNLTSNISVNNKAKMTTEGYVVGTWLQVTNTTDIGNSNWSDVWVNHNGWLYKRNKSDFVNDLGLDNYVPITRTINSKALSSDISLNNKDVGALPDYTITISHQSAGNPRMVKFVSVNYASAATCFKMGAMTCHDNGVSYQFLTDMLIAVTTGGEVTANIYKFAQTSIGNVDGVARYTGDVFYVNDTTNKIVDFYILCGQWSVSQFTPVTKVGSTTIAYVTQYSGDANYYSSGDKVWVNGCGTTYARLSDIPTTYIKTASVTGTTLTLTDKAGTTTTFSGGVYKGTCSTQTGTTSIIKIVDCPGFILEKGAIIDVTFTNSNGGMVKLNVNNTGEKNVVYKEIGLTSDYNTTTSAGGADKSIPYGGWSAGDTVRFFYDGSTWVEIMNLTQGIPYSIPYQAKNAYVSTTRDNSDNSTNIATTAFVHTAIDAALEAGTGSEGVYLPLAGGQMTGQLLLDSSGLLFPSVYGLTSEGILPSANSTQFKIYKPGDAFTKGLIYNYGSGITEREGAITFTENATYSTTTKPTALSYGRLQAYGTLNINGNTDNSGTEYVNITAGHGCSSSTADGLSIGTDTLTWKDQPVIHSGNIGTYGVEGKTSDYISSKYLRFCQLETNVGSSFSFATFLITAGGDFGGKFVGTYLVTIGTREGTDGSIKVLCLQKPSLPSSFKFGYRVNPDDSNRVDYFMYGATYNFSPIKVICLTKGGDYQVNTDLVEIAEPSSYTTASYNGDIECGSINLIV